MKLLTVLMLAALPLFCYAGTGCQLVRDVVDKTMDSSVTPEAYAEYLQPYTAGPHTAKALKTMKECFNSQTPETLANAEIMVETIYNSDRCKNYEE